MTPRYVDIHGNESERPAHVAPIWRTSCYAVIRRGSALLMSRPLDSPRWELPGGGVQPAVDASLMAAAIRECYEETGYTVIPEAGTLRFGGEIFIHARRTDRYLNALTFYLDGAIDGGPDPAWLANPIEDVEVAWLDPASLNRETAIWFHLDALRQFGTLP